MKIENFICEKHKMNSGLLLFAKESDFNDLFPLMPISPELQSPVEVGEIIGKKLFAAVIGEGEQAENKTAEYIDNCNPSCIFWIGKAQSLSKCVNEGDIVITSRAIIRTESIEYPNAEISKFLFDSLFKNKSFAVHFGFVKYGLPFELNQNGVISEVIAADLANTNITGVCKEKNVPVAFIEMIINPGIKCLNPDQKKDMVYIYNAITSTFASISSDSSKKYFAYLDILGFKKQVEDKTPEQLCNFVNNFFSSFSMAIDESRTIGNEKIDLRELNFRLYSDSILIWTNSVRYHVFSCLVSAIIALMKAGFENRIPLRGILTYGDIFIKPCSLSDEFFSNEAIYGKALVEAYSMEVEQEWSGCYVTAKAWEAMKENWSKACTSYESPECFFNEYPYMIWAEIPFKKGAENGIAINWNALGVWDDKKRISECEVKNAFGIKNLEEKEIKKRDNTLSFLRLSKEIIPIVKGCKPGNIAVPPKDYGEIKAVAENSFLKKFFKFGQQLFFRFISLFYSKT